MANRTVATNSVTSKRLARQYGSGAFKRGNLPLAWRWFSRYDALVILENIRRNSNPT